MVFCLNAGIFLRAVPVAEKILDLFLNSLCIEIAYNGETRKLLLAVSASDYRAQKNQYSQIRETLTELGIIEGQEFVPAKRSRRPTSPEMVAARAKQRKEFDAWQEVWRTIREAERSLDVEYEISQMLDYY